MPPSQSPGSDHLADCPIVVPSILGSFSGNPNQLVLCREDREQGRKGQVAGWRSRGTYSGNSSWPQDQESPTCPWDLQSLQRGLSRSNHFHVVLLGLHHWKWPHCSKDRGGSHCQRQFCSQPEASRWLPPTVQPSGPASIDLKTIRRWQSRVFSGLSWAWAVFLDS